MGVMRQSISSRCAALLTLGFVLSQPAMAGTVDEDPHAKHKAMMSSTASAPSESAHYVLPDVTMLDQHGEALGVQSLFDTDRPVMVNFIFTTCTAICPMMTSIFQQVQERLGDDAARVLMVSVSIDPEADSPAALKEYAEQFRAGDQWVFLTGSLEDSIAIQEGFEAYRGDKMNHAPLTLLRPAGSHEWTRFDGFATAAQLEQALRESL
jgi:protein SCO1/2